MIEFKLWTTLKKLKQGKLIKWEKKITLNKLHKFCLFIYFKAILNDMNDVKNYNILGMKEKMEKD
jgi:hypothetical protein